MPTIKKDLKTLSERLLLTRGDEKADASKIKETAYVLADKVVEFLKQNTIASKSGFFDQELFRQLIEEGRYNKSLFLQGCAFVFILDKCMDRPGKPVLVQSNLKMSATKMVLIADALMGIASDSEVCRDKKEALRISLNEVIEEAKSKMFGNKAV
jgi:hypothetical protein